MVQGVYEAGRVREDCLGCLKVPGGGGSLTSRGRHPKASLAPQGFRNIESGSLGLLSFLLQPPRDTHGAIKERQKHV